ncbi:hypothetical protein BsWGS_18433 [Bradybaena similaris]
MCAGLYLALGVLTVLLTSQCHGQGQCPTGWWGPECKYMCHCNISQTCDATDGSCPAGDTCAKEYMGPSCQYRDLMCRMGRRTPAFLYDCDDRTCNPQNSATTVNIEHRSYGVGFVAYFFRVVVNDARKLQQFTLSLNQQPCRPDRRFYVSPTAVDVHCDNILQPIMMSMTGQAVGALCSLNIVAGRNVALKGKTFQSSNSSTHPEWGLSPNAVDGNTRNIYDEKSSCSQTAIQLSATWGVKFDWPVVICDMHVYNRDVSQKSLEAFSAYTVYADNPVYVSENKAIRIAKPLYELAFYDPNPSSFANITQSRTASGVMTLCEVEMFGDVWCEDGKWGLFCEKLCTCNDSQICSVVTGACSSPCPAGKYSFRCYKTCSRQCIHKCSERYGLCKCRRGAQEDICLRDCKNGTYGRKCQFNCSQYCTDICNPMTGRCTCMYNRTGVGCAECPIGKYGEQCHIDCSKFCAGNKCNSVNGSCTCLYDRLGLECAECPAGRYGETCNLTCPANCLNNGCDSVTGKCPSCKGNYSGDFCTDCLTGTYGGECTLSCPLYCADHKCNRTTGRCFSCAGHQTGENCTVCAKTYYGVGCAKKCSALCLNSLCNATTGICFVCVKGYIGAYCNKEEEQKLKPIYAVIVLAPTSTLSCVCCFCCGCCLCCFSTPQEEPGEEGEEEGDDETVATTVISAD